MGKGQKGRSYSTQVRPPRDRILGEKTGYYCSNCWGGGSAGIAAIESGLSRWKGIELDKTTCEAAVKRIKTYSKPDDFLLF